LSFVNDTKKELQEMRNEGGEELISKVIKICNTHNVSDMDVPYPQRKSPLCNKMSDRWLNDCLCNLYRKICSFNN